MNHLPLEILHHILLFLSNKVLLQYCAINIVTRLLYNDKHL